MRYVLAVQTDTHTNDVTNSFKNKAFYNYVTNKLVIVKLVRTLVVFVMYLQDIRNN